MRMEIRNGGRNEERKRKGRKKGEKGRKEKPNSVGNNISLPNVTIPNCYRQSDKINGSQR